LQDELPGSMLATGPASRGRDHQVYGSIQFDNKIEGRTTVPLLIQATADFNSASAAG
jgi:hypothetical protein